MFGRKKEEFRDFDDRLIVFDDDQQTASIDYVDAAENGKITVVGKHTVPVEDCEIVNGEVDGVVVRLYFYRAPTESVQTTANLAHLEKSIVLNQITEYNDPMDHEKGFDFVKAALFGLLAIAIIMGMSSCGAGVM